MRQSSTEQTQTTQADNPYRTYIDGSQSQDFAPEDLLASARLWAHLLTRIFD